MPAEPARITTRTRASTTSTATSSSNPSPPQPTWRFPLPCRDCGNDYLVRSAYGSLNSCVSFKKQSPKDKDTLAFSVNDDRSILRQVECAARRQLNRRAVGTDGYRHLFRIVYAVVHGFLDLIGVHGAHPFRNRFRGPALMLSVRSGLQRLGRLPTTTAMPLKKTLMYGQALREITNMRSFSSSAHKYHVLLFVLTPINKVLS